jgi:hypothetical protein
MSAPLERDGMESRQADLREALQHRAAAAAQLRETQESATRLIARARALLARNLRRDPAARDSEAEGMRMERQTHREQERPDEHRRPLDPDGP